MSSTNERPMITSAAALLAAYADGERDFPWRVRLPWDADLTGAHLRDADLTGADLRDADLRGANLTDADLTGADLTDARLTDADLSGADLSGALLTGALLSDADLSDEQLRAANTTAIRADVWRICDTYPAEVPALLAALEAGRINGSVYEEEDADGNFCGCLMGTIGHTRGTSGANLPDADADSAAERWALAICLGDTPATSPIAAITAEWLRAWLEEHPQPEPPQPSEPNEPELRPIAPPYPSEY